MVLTAKVLLEQNPRPSREEIREAIAGNICRCTGYVQIVDAVELAARRMHGTVTVANENMDAASDATITDRAQLEEFAPEHADTPATNAV
jgi:carbon-monoxide dehydrogenase small subunit